MEFLSNIELYFCDSVSEELQSFILIDEEFHHCAKVMRNKSNETIYATDGLGNIFEGTISEIKNDSIRAEVVKKFKYKNQLQHFTFYIPNIKNPERLRFALEKCTELGITNFVLFNSDRTISKGFKKERLHKVVKSAMKQSLRSFLPKITFINSISEIAHKQAENVLFDQNASLHINEYNFITNNNYLMIFGPEGGFTQKEISDINPNLTLRLIGNRLRSETAVIKAASLIS